MYTSPPSRDKLIRQTAQPHVEELAKPWLNLEAYREARVREAVYEAELAEEFLKSGLVRNAAGKAFQAWKSLLGAMLVDKVEGVEKVYPGVVKIREGKRVKKALWVVALVPTSQMKKLAQLLGGEESALTSIALDLHSYQHNGPDPEGIYSPYPDEETAKRDVELLVKKVREYIAKLPRRR